MRPIGPKMQAHVPDEAAEFIQKAMREENMKQADVVRGLIVIGVRCLEGEHSDKVRALLAKVA